MPRKTPLYAQHNRALNLEYAGMETFALGQETVLLGTAGSVIERTNAAGFAYFAHKFLDGDRSPREHYLAGPVGSDDAETVANAMREQIAEVKDLVPTLRMLGREGFNLVDAKTYSTLAALHNHGVFVAGGMLIGSHAYGVLLNRMGVRATPYATEDIDIARREALAFKKVPTKGLLDILCESGIDFVAVPSLNRKEPATSFKQKGKARFHVDLLVPSANESFPTVAVPELQAHATALPYLKYLLSESQTAMLMAREGCCSVRIPLPERFAVHKLVVSRLRIGREAKSTKDVEQAAVLLAALADLYPGAIEDAVAAVSKRMMKHLRRSFPAVRPVLEERSPQAWAELTGED
ncbi:MAG: hypothetical protein JKY86_07565 [Gammaproteobacteria bacterium]|nr:hypothetical protein [Gammaproteobacteria bacterium]